MSEVEKNEQEESLVDSLRKWLNVNKIKYRFIDNDIVDIPGFGKAYINDMGDLSSILRKNRKENKLVFNLMCDKESLLNDGVDKILYQFGDNWYWFDLNKGFIRVYDDKMSNFVELSAGSIMFEGKDPGTNVVSLKMSQYFMYAQNKGTNKDVNLSFYDDDVYVGPDTPYDSEFKALPIYKTLSELNSKIPDATKWNLIGVSSGVNKLELPAIFTELLVIAILNSSDSYSKYSIIIPRELLSSQNETHRFKAGSYATNQYNSEVLINVNTKYVWLASLYINGSISTTTCGLRVYYR